MSRGVSVGAFLFVVLVAALGGIAVARRYRDSRGSPSRRSRRSSIRSWEHPFESTIPIPLTANFGVSGATSAHRDPTLGYSVCLPKRRACHAMRARMPECGQWVRRHDRHVSTFLIASMRRRACAASNVMPESMRRTVVAVTFPR